MNIFKISGLIILSLIILIISFLAYMGMFSNIKITEKETGPYLIAYESFVGPYAQSGKVFDKVYKALKSENIETLRGCGIYYDNPADVPAEKLRSDCGVIIEEKDLAAFEKVKSKYKTKTIQKATRLVAEFPKKNMLSYMFGPMKVYPAFNKYCKAKGYNESTLGYEIYDETNKKIIFLMNKN
ncbi:GyrI-like domain-containing protein [Candidatus Margulisiibacteriota bacterium]